MRQEDFARPHFKMPPRKYPNRGSEMWLARITPAKPDHGQRTFECPECDHSITEVVKYNSASAWLGPSSVGRNECPGQRGDDYKQLPASFMLEQ